MEEEEGTKKESGFSEQAEKIKMLSKMMGGPEMELKPEDLMQAMEMAQKLSPLFAAQKEEAAEERTALKGREELFPMSREVRILQAAMPFLDKEVQRAAFMLSKVLELREAGQQKTLAIASSEKEERRRGDKRGAMLAAIRPYLGEGEQKQVDTLLRMMKMREMMKLMNILSKEEE